MSELTAGSGYVYSSLGLDADFGDLVAMFVDELPQRVSAIQASWEQGDMEGLARAAHQLKGAVGSYGFSELTPALRHLDQCVRTSRPAGEILAAIEEVAAWCSRARSGAPA